MSTERDLLSRSEAKSMSAGEVFAKTREKLGLPANADVPTVLAAVDDLKRTTVRNRVCAKLGLARDVDDETLYDAIYARVVRPAPPSPSSSTGAGPEPRAGARTGVAFARNPLLDEMRANGLTGGQGTPPTLFPGGDVPAYTASGNDPQALLQLPTCLRHAAAKANAAEWARLFNEFATGGPDDDLAAQFDPASQDRGNDEYQARFRAWRSGRPAE